ncbi:MAG: hypothetical protein IJU91_10845, partial [Selenomonadaceae bacterium]|nr:hypothetical protein [Selenomonadaceae bacterium]
GITESQLTNYLAETKRTDVTKNVDVTEEMIADAMQKILSRVAKKNHNLVQRFLAWLKDTFQKFKDLFQNPKGKLTRGQYAKLADTFGKMAAKLTDADGNKIFRYNTRTHNLELANGESLENLLDDTEIESSDEQGFFNLDGLSLAGAKFSRNNEDNTAGTLEENDEISQKLFEKYLTEGIMKMVRETVAKEIDEYVDFSKMNDPVVRDQARDRLPYIRKMLIWYNQVQNNQDYKNHFAARIEYARRCFENDERIRTESVRQINGDDRQGREYKNSPHTFSGNAVGKINSDSGRITRGLSRNVGGEVSGARKHFLKLYDELKNELNQRPENKNQGVFKFSIGSSSNSGNTNNNNSSEGAVRKWFNGITQKISRALHIDGDHIVTAETAAKRLRAEREKAMDDYIKNPSKENRQRLKELKISRLMLDAYKNGEEYVNDLTLSDMYRRSPSRIAEKVAAFRAYFRMGDKAMDKLVRLRDRFTVGLNAATDFLKNKDDNESLTNLLIDGDANEMEYGVLTEQEKDSIKASTSPENVTKKLQQARIQKICAETGVSENVAKAYVKIRQLMTQAYHMLNEAKRRPQINSKHCSDAEITALKNNKFVTITRISDNTDENGNRLVTYKRYAHTEKKYTVTESVLNRFKKDPAMQVVKATVKGIENGEKIYYVEVREGIAELTNKAGYVPHLFHEYMIRVKDKDGKIVERFGYGGVIGSGRTQVEAVKIAEEWQKKNPNALQDGEEIYIAPKIANFKELGMDESNYAPIMGDKDFDSMVHNIA